MTAPNVNLGWADDERVPVVWPDWGEVDLEQRFEQESQRRAMQAVRRTLHFLVEAHKKHPEGLHRSVILLEGILDNRSSSEVGAMLGVSRQRAHRLLTEYRAIVGRIADQC